MEKNMATSISDTSVTQLQTYLLEQLKQTGDDERRAFALQALGKLDDEDLPIPEIAAVMLTPSSNGSGLYYDDGDPVWDDGKDILERAPERIPVDLVVTRLQAAAEAEDADDEQLVLQLVTLLDPVADPAPFYALLEDAAPCLCLAGVRAVHELGVPNAAPVQRLLEREEDVLVRAEAIYSLAHCVALQEEALATLEQQCLNALVQAMSEENNDAIDVLQTILSERYLEIPQQQYLDTFIQAMAEEDSDRLEAVRTILSEKYLDISLDVFGALSSDSDPVKRRVALEGFFVLDAFDRILPALDDLDPTVRMLAIENLGYSEHAEQLPIDRVSVIRANDPDERVRNIAAYYLQRYAQYHPEPKTVVEETAAN
jgi:HEAT repeat protein